MSATADNLITFSPGTVIQSAQVNQNYSDIVQLTGGSVGSNLQTLLANNFSQFVQSGGVMTTASGLTVNMTASYIVVSGMTYYMPAQSFVVSASKDTYIDFAPGSTPTYNATAVSNGASSPTLNGVVRMGKIVSGASSVSSITQTGVDSNFIPYRPLSMIPFPQVLGNIFSNQIQSYTNGGTAGGTFYYLNLGGLKILFGTTSSSLSSSSTSTTYSLNFPTGFFNGRYAEFVTNLNENQEYQSHGTNDETLSATGTTLVTSSAATTTVMLSYFTIGY